MSDVNEKGAVSKDGAQVVNARLMELINALSKSGFRVLKIDTNGTEYNLMIRDTAD